MKRILSLIGVCGSMGVALVLDSCASLLCPCRPPLYEECIDTDLLEEQGGAYQKRGNNLADISNFSPEPGESYQHYWFRVVNTIHAQDNDIKTLMQAIEQKSQSIHDLDDQLSELKAQHIDMRLALATTQKENDPKINALFSRYIIQEGDTLQDIAYQRYATHTGWLNIYRFNHHNLPFGPNNIEKGQVLLIPNESNLGEKPSAKSNRSRGVFP